MLYTRLGGLLGLLVASVPLYWSVRIAAADWVSKDGTRDSIRAALRMTPVNWECYREWAELVPADAVEAMRQSVLLNPVNPMLWLELAEVAEKAGRDSEAEASLREAIRLDKTAGPRTLLAEFYFRRKDVARFWPAARAALEAAASGPTVLFADCWQLSTDAGFILRTAIPERPEILADYLHFLVAENHADAAEPVAMKVMRGARTAQAGQAVRAYCDQMAEHHRAEAAVTAWDWLSKEKVIPYGELGIRAGRWVTNGDWRVDPGEAQTGSGFGWRIADGGGWFAEYSKKERTLRIRFSGEQPERCQVLSEFAPLWPGKHYGLRVSYETRGIDRQSGLSWRVVMPSGAVIGEVALAGETGERLAQLSFAGPDSPTVGQLVLVYERTLGTVRIEGEVEIRRVDGSVN